MDSRRAADVIPFPARQRTYVVRVFYREPTYELQAGPRPEPFCWAYRIHAENEEGAIQQALEEFRRMERLSSVGWVRIITGTEVQEA